MSEVRKLLSMATCFGATAGLSLFGAVDADALLGTSGRSDLVGPEVWTISFTGGESGGTADSYTRAARDAWLPPSPGLSGLLHIVHQTGISDALTPVVTECTASNRVHLSFGPVRNRWTPSGMLTYYRSASRRELGDSPRIGGTVLRERKCITPDNVFVAEVKLVNASSRPRRYALGLASKLTNGVFRFTTESRCKRIARTCATAFGADRGLGEVELPRNGELTFRYGAAFDAGAPEAAAAKLRAALADRGVFEANRRHVNGWFEEKVPAFESDDVDLVRLYLYRWFVVYRALHEARRVIADHEYPRLAAYESPCGGWYGCVVGLPLPMQILEMSWMRDPLPARAQILGWTENHPHYTDYIQFTPMSVWRNQLNHPDRELAALALPRVTPGVPEGGELPDQVSSWPTGAEYQPNFYQFTEPKWDWRHDCEMRSKGFGLTALKRMDTAAYEIGGLLGGARLARMLGETAKAEPLERRAEAMRRTLLERHWDGRLGLFLSSDPKTGRLADEAVCYDSFAPYLWGMVDDPKYFRAFDRVSDPAWFGADFPVPTVARNCPMYSSFNAIIGPVESSESAPHEYGCCWNGPTWHYSDSLVAMAFGEVARREAARRPAWLAYFTGWNETHFAYGDRTLLRAAEHFRPEDGARFGWTSDYFHSAWVEPFIRFWCGVDVSEDLRTVTFDPFADGGFSLRRVPLGGREYDFIQRADASGRRLEILDSRTGKTLAAGCAPLRLDVAAPPAAAAAMPFRIASDAMPSICLQGGMRPFVTRAATDLADDLERIFGTRPQVVTNAGASANAIVLRKAGSGFERYSLASGPENTLVVSGSDDRGVMFGVYRFCADFLGVDPFYFWSGLEPERRTERAWPEGIELVQGEPAFKYRGWLEFQALALLRGA